MLYLFIRVVAIVVIAINAVQFASTSWRQLGENADNDSKFYTCEIHVIHIERMMYTNGITQSW